MGLANKDQPQVLRVANLIEEGRWGGPQKRISLVAAELKRLSVDTTVLLPIAESDHFRQVLDEAGVKWKALSLRRLGRGWHVLLGFAVSLPGDIFRLWRELKTGDYDLLHVSGGAWQFKGPIAGRLAGIPVIWHLNDTQMPAPLVVLFRCTGYIADAFIVSAKRVRAYYLDGTSLGRMPSYVVPPPVVTRDLSRELVVADEAVQALASPRIVTVANINPIKGLETLIEAASILKSRMEFFSISIVGPVPSTQARYFSMLNDMVEQRGLRAHVHFVGKRSHVEGVLKSADIYVCSSYAESGPMAVWEAMSMSCAIVSTDVGDVSKYLSNGENGFVIPVRNPEAMADAICKLAKDEALRIEFGKKAREVACQRLDIGVIAEKTANAYRLVAEKILE